MLFALFPFNEEQGGDVRSIIICAFSAVEALEIASEGLVAMQQQGDHLSLAEANRCTSKHPVLVAVMM